MTERTQPIRIAWHTWAGLFLAALAPAITLGIFQKQAADASLRQSIENERTIAGAIQEIGELKDEFAAVRIDLRSLVRHEERFNAVEKRLERLEGRP